MSTFGAGATGAGAVAEPGPVVTGVAGAELGVVAVAPGADGAAGVVAGETAALPGNGTGVEPAGAVVVAVGGGTGGKPGVGATGSALIGPEPAAGADVVAAAGAVAGAGCVVGAAEVVAGVVERESVSSTRRDSSVSLEPEDWAAARAARPSVAANETAAMRRRPVG
jgi:hypothetical protein